MAANDTSKASNDPKKSEYIFVTKSVVPITTNFENVLKCHNDSSLDNVLEFRCLLSESYKDDPKGKSNNDANSKKDKSYSGEVQQFIQKILDRKANECIEATLEDEISSDSLHSLISSNNEKEVKDQDSGCKSENDSGTSSTQSISDLIILKKEKICEEFSGNNPPTAFASSTPIKSTNQSIRTKSIPSLQANLDISGVGFLNFDANDSGNAKSEHLNDSDFESMDQDQYESLNEKVINIPDLDETLVNRVNENDDDDIEEEAVPRMKRSGSSEIRSSFRMILETTVKKTPQAFRKAFNIPEPNEEPAQTYSSKFMNLFSSNKKRRQSLKKRDS